MKERQYKTYEYSKKEWEEDVNRGIASMYREALEYSNALEKVFL